MLGQVLRVTFAMERSSLLSKEEYHQFESWWISPRNWSESVHRTSMDETIKFLGVLGFLQGLKIGQKRVSFSLAQQCHTSFSTSPPLIQGHKRAVLRCVSFFSILCQDIQSLFGGLLAWRWYPWELTLQSKVLKKESQSFSSKPSEILRVI